MILEVSIQLRWKNSKAVAACSSVLNPTKPNLLNFPSSVYLSCTSVTIPFSLKSSLILFSVTYKRNKNFQNTLDNDHNHVTSNIEIYHSHFSVNFSQLISTWLINFEVLTTNNSRNIPFTRYQQNKLRSSGWLRTTCVEYLRVTSRLSSNSQRSRRHQRHYTVTVVTSAFWSREAIYYVYCSKNWFKLHAVMLTSY